MALRWSYLCFLNTYRSILAGCWSPGQVLSTPWSDWDIVRFPWLPQLMHQIDQSTKERGEFQQHSCDKLEKGNPYISSWKHRIKGKKKQKIKIPFSVSSLWVSSVTFVRRGGIDGFTRPGTELCELQRLQSHMVTWKTHDRLQTPGPGPGRIPSLISFVKPLNLCHLFVPLFTFLKKWSLAPITYFNKRL